MSLNSLVEKINDDLRGTGWHAYMTPGWYLYAECQNGHVAELEEVEIVKSLVADVRAGGGGCISAWCDEGEI